LEPDFFPDDLELEDEPEPDPIPGVHDRAETVCLNKDDVNEEFRLACVTGDVDRASVLLSSKDVNINARDAAFKTPLHYAAEMGEIQICSLLLSRNAFKNSKDSGGRTPLLCAAFKGQLGAVKFLIEEGCFTFVTDEDGNGLLHLAALSGNHLLVKWIVNHCDVDSELLNASDQCYQDLLPALPSEDQDTEPQTTEPNDEHEDQDNASSEDGDVDEEGDQLEPKLVVTSSPVASITQPKKSISLLTHQTTEALLNACFSGDFAVALRLLPMSDVNCQHQSSLTPLHFSCHLGNLEFSEALLRAGANPNAQDRKGMTPLHYSCQNRNIYLIELLFCSGVTFVSDHRGFTPLHLAAIAGDEEIFKLLVAHGGDMNEIDHSGNSAFFYLVEAKSIELATWSVENHTPNIYLANLEDVTPLDVARNYGFVEFCSIALAHHQRRELEAKVQSNTMRLFELVTSAHWNRAEDLLSSPFDANLAINGTYLLHICCESNQLRLVEVLLHRGAHVNVQNDESMSPLMCAAKGPGDRARELIICLISNHADVAMKDKNGWTALFYAIAGNHLSISKILYGHSPGFECDNNDNTILHIACHHRSLDCIRWLTMVVGLVLCEEIVNRNGDTPLMIAKKYNDYEVLTLSQHQSETMRAENTAAFVTALHANDLPRAFSLSKVIPGINPHEIDLATGKIVFHLACERGDVEIVKALLDQGASISLVGQNGMNSLHCACLAGQLEIIRWLKKIGSSFETVARNGMTPLHFACQSGNLAAVRWLIDRGVIPSVCSTDSTSALHYASTSGNKELVAYLLSDHQFDLNATNSSGLLPIDFAAREGAVELVLWLSKKMTLSESALTKLKSKAATIRKQKLLREHELHLREGAMIGDLNKIQTALEFGININSTGGTDGYTALHFACRENKINAVQYLLKKEASVNSESSEGLTPLHIAAQKGHIEVFNLLLKYDANIRAVDKDGNDILIHASSCCHNSELAKIILLKFPHFNECRRNRLGVSAIVAAASSGNSELVLWIAKNSWIKRQHRRFFEALVAGAINMIEEFIDGGIDLNMTDEEGQSPLHILCHLGLLKLIRKSIQFGANENAKDATFRTPLHLAAERGHTEIVKYLCEMRVTVDAVDHLGMTPLLDACRNGHILTIAYLVGQGANITVSNLEESNALHLACQGGDFSLVQWLCKGFKIPEDQLNRSSKSPRDIALDLGHKNIFTFLDARKQARDEEAYLIQQEAREIELEKERIEAELEAKRQEAKAHEAMLENQRLQLLAEEQEIEARAQELLKTVASQQLLELSRSGKVEDLKELLTCDVDVNSALSPEKWTPLHFACQHGSLEMIEALIKAGAEVNTITTQNETPLLIAMRCHASDPTRGCDCFWVLFDHGAKIDFRSSEGLTALHRICENGNDLLWNQLFRTELQLPRSLLEDLVRYAAGLNRVHMLKVLLQLGIDIDASGVDGKAALHFASETGSMDCLSALIDAGATIDITDEAGKTPLMSSVASHRFDAVSFLVNKHASVFNVDHKGNTPLHYACHSGDLKIGTFLVQHGADIYSVNVSSETPFHIAVRTNKGLANFLKRDMERTAEILDICSSGDNEGLLLMKSKDFDLTRRDKDRVSGLHLAAQNGHQKVCHTLLKSGLHVDSSDRHGKTPMSYACAHGQLAIVKFLYEQGADLQHRAVDMRSYLHLVASTPSESSASILQWLIDHHLNCNEMADENYTPLHDAAAVTTSNSSVIDILLKNGAVVSSRTSSGLTPFNIACQKNNFKVALLFLEHPQRSDIDAADSSGLTSFLQACLDNRFEMVEWLYSQGANYWISDNNGDTPLHLASRSKVRNLIEWLVMKGLDLHALNKTGLSPIDLAIEHRARDLVNWMKSESSDPVPRATALVRELEVALQKNNISLMDSLFQELYVLHRDSVVVANSRTMLLCGAAALDSIEIIDLLFQSGAKVTAKAPISGMTALHCACKQGHLRVVNYLISKGAPVNARDCKAQTPLDLALSFHHSNIAEVLQTLGGSSNNEFLHDTLTTEIDEEEIEEIAFDESINPLHAACARGECQKVQFLLEYSNDLVNASLQQNQRTPLHVSIIDHPHEEIVNILLAHGADPNLFDLNGMSPLHYACQLRRDSIIVVSLIKYQGSLTLPTARGDTSLHLICRNNLVELMADILDLPRSILKNLNLNVVDGQGRNLLYTAVEVGSMEMVRQLLHQGVRVNYSDQHLVTPLHVAVTRGQYEIMKLLLDNGADPNAADAHGQTPISLSITEIKDVNYSRLLHKFGGKLDQLFENGETLLHIACRNGNVELAKWLVRSGLNPSTENLLGKSPVELAHSCGKEDLLEWLLAWIVAVRVDRPVEMILAEATGSSPIEACQTEVKEENCVTETNKDPETLHGISAPLPPLSTRSKNASHETSRSRSHRQIALL
jgi:ankyrin repeat protein